MRFATGAGLLLGLLVASGCSPAQSTKVNDVDTSHVATPHASAQDSGPLTPVPAPKDVFVLARMKHPSTSLERLGDWVHFPIPWREGLERELPALAKHIDANAPLDVAVSLDPSSAGSPEPLFAVSIGLSDVASTVDALRTSGRQVEMLSSGGHFVKLKSDVRCTVSRANGSAPGRLVCSETRKALDVLGPYMARTLPTEALADEDLFIVVRAEPLQQRFGKKAHMLKVGVPIFLREVTLGNARFDGAMADAAHGVADEVLSLIEEVREARISAKLDDPGQAARLEMEFELSGGKSFSSRVLTQAIPTAKPAPEMFWSLPKEVTSASYAVGSTSADLYRPIVSTLRELMLGAAEHFAVKTPSVERWLDAYEKVASFEGASVYASGRSAAAGAPAKKADAGALFSNVLGHHIVGVEGDDGRVQGFIDQTIQVLNDPKLRKLGEQEVDEKLKHLPLVKKIPAKGLPAGSSVYELRLSPKELKRLAPEAENLASPVVLRLSSTKVGQRTWFVFTSEEPGAILDAVLSQDPAKTLASRPGLEALRAEPAVSGGFMTLAEYARSLEAIDDVEGGEAKIGARDVLLAMPAHGETPILFKSGAAAGPTLVLSVTAPKAALQDATAAAVSLAARGGAL